MHRPTPCVGICSTTYGDLVCRGCKRFAHEIVEWNGYEAGQQQAVWGRLSSLREGSTASILSEVQIQFLCAHAEADRLRGRPGTKLSEVAIAYEVLRRLARFAPPTGAPAGGAELPGVAPDNSPRTLLERIDQEFYARSEAVYEHSFRVLTR